MSSTLEYTTSSTTRMRMVAVATEKVTAKGFLEAAYGGKIRFAKERASGTLRHWPVLAPGSAERKKAEAVMEKKDAKVTVEAIAKSLNVSVPTVRRMITAYQFTLELEHLKGKALAEVVRAANANMAKPEVEAPTEAKPEVEAPKAKRARKPKAEKVAEPEVVTLEVAPEAAAEPTTEGEPTPEG